MEQFIVDFIKHLRNAEFKISNENINHFFLMLSKEDILIDSIEDLLMLLKICFCKNKKEYFILEKIFYDFFDELKMKKQVENLKNDREKFKKNFKAEKETNVENLKNLEKEIKEIEDRILSEETEKVSFFTKKEKEFIENNEDKIKKIKLKSDKSFIKELIDKDEEKLINRKNTKLKEIEREISSISEEFLMKGNVNEFYVLKELFNLTHKISNLDEKQFKKKELKAKKETKELSKKKEKIKEKIRKLEEEYKRTQKQLENVLKGKDIQVKKDTSIYHREEFLENGNAVISNSKGELEFLDKEFSTLSEKEMIEIYSYIHKNLLKFKTKMNRNINSTKKTNLNVQKTIQEACKTGGLPLTLHFKEPKKNKSNLVLVLDISGSCKEASKMMLTFMYLLQDTFINGCKTYAFVNSLFDVSNIMDAENIESSINGVFSTIPTKGVYSNYYEPLRCLWEDKKNVIDKDSIVIFMGDARNNKNMKGDNYLKSISRKAKKCYWLNTEEHTKWGVADSVAYDYMKYTKMFEIINLSQLIYFIENI